MKDVLQKHFDLKKLPLITKWKAKCDKLIAYRGRTENDYAELRNEVKESEQMWRSIHSIMERERERQPRSRAHDADR